MRGLLVTLILTVFALPGVGRADEFRAEASVDRDVVGVGDHVFLTIEVYGVNQATGPDLENIEGFRLVNTSKSQTLSIVNFDAVRLLTLQYVLVAMEEGEYVLGPFQVQSGNQTYETEALKVTVVKGQAPPPKTRESDSGEAVLVRASADKTRAYVGEQITYNLEFAYSVRPRDVQYTPPEHTGFWTEDIGETGPAVETINGKRYYVVNKRTAFFPISSGDFTIGQATVRYRVGESSLFGFDPFDVTRGRQGQAVTEPVSIAVRPLPAEGRPAGFSGAVGDFTFKVTSSSGEVKTGESLTLSVAIRGRGNIKSIGDIDVPELEGFRVFAPKARQTIDVEKSQVGGEKVFDLVLVPERPGEYLIDGFEFSYFNPRRQDYVTLVADPLPVSVLQGERAASGSIQGGTPGQMATRKDIRHIKRVDIGLDSLVLSGRGLGSLVLRYLPVVVVVVGLIVSVGRRRAVVSGRAALNRACRGGVRELRAAAETVAGGGEIADAAGRAARAVRSYLASGTGISEALVDGDTIPLMVGLSEATKDDLTDLLVDLDRIRFAPVGAESAEVAALIERARSLLMEVNSRWSK